jgi:hypothetical protein
MQRLSAHARTLPEQEIARRLIRPDPAQAMVGDIFSDLHQRIGHHLPADIAVREHRLRMKANTILPLLDVNRVVAEGDGL